MTREELMDDIEIGQMIKIYSVTGDVYFGKVDSFGPSGLKIIQTNNGVAKRILYERISEYDVDISIDDSMTVTVPNEKSRRVSTNKIQRETIFNPQRSKLSFDVIINLFENQIGQQDKNKYIRIKNMLDYARKVHEYHSNSDRVIKAIAELNQLAQNNLIFKLYIAAIQYDLGDLTASADNCYDCQKYQLAFYLFEKIGNNDMMFRAAVMAIDSTEDEYIIWWLCEYAVNVNNAHIIKRIAIKNKKYASKALVYWFCSSSVLCGVESLEQAFEDVNVKKMQKAISEIDDVGAGILSFVAESSPSSKETLPTGSTKEKTGTITYYNKDGGNGYIKEDDGGSIYFYIKQVKDYALQKELFECNRLNPKIRVKYIRGRNHTGKIAADCVESIIASKAEPKNPAPTHSGFIFEYDVFSQYGKICSNNQFYNFKFDSIRDPFLRAVIESRYTELELEVKFNLKTRKNVRKRIDEVVACDIVGTTQYSDEKINEWIKYRILTQKEVDAWIGNKNSNNEISWRIAEYEPLLPIDSEKETTEAPVRYQNNILTLVDQEEQICNELISDIQNPFISMPRINESRTNYREQARKYFLVTKTDDNERGILEKAEGFFIKAIQAGEQLQSTIPELVNVYIRLGGYEKTYILKGLQLLSTFGHLIPSESLMHLRIQLVDKGEYKEALEKLLENSIKKCTKLNTKYHYMSMLAGRYLATGKYEQARKLFEKCITFLDKNKDSFLNYEKMRQWPMRSIIIADYYDGDKVNAIQKAKEFLLLNPDDATIRAIVDGSFDETQKDEILEDIIDSVPYLKDNTTDDSFLVSELFSNYSAYVLEKCEYSQIRDRKYDEESGRYIWIPENEEKASGVYDSLAQSSSIFGKDGKLRPGTYEEVADKRLNMAKIAEYCLRNSTDLNLTNARTTFWKGRFIWATSQCMWLRHKIYSMRQNFIGDTASYFLQECISMFFKDANYIFRYEFYDAINLFFALQSGISNTDFVQIEIKKAEKLNKKSEGAKKVEDEIVRLEKIVSNTFDLIFKKDSKRAIKVLGMILESCNKEAAAYLSRLLSSLDKQLKNEFAAWVIVTAEDDYSLEDCFVVFSQKLQRNYRELIFSLQAINDAILSANFIELNIALDAVEKLLNNDDFLPMSDTDISRCKKLVDQIKMYIHLKNTASSNYEISQERANSIKNEATNLQLKYEENPTRVSHDSLCSLMQTIYDEMIKIGEEITIQSLPEITVEDEYEEEGYFPQNEKLNLMLLISNGKSGKQCTTASNIQLDIDYDDMLKKYIYIEQTHFNLVNSLPGGEYNSQQIVLHLTNEGKNPDTIFAMKAKVTYQTIKGTEDCLDVVLNIHIKGEDAFTEIQNPYDVKDIKPKGKNATLFKGRSADVANISNKLLAGDRGKTILIYGQYRSGKTSLANFIVDEIDSRDESVIIVDGITVTESDSAWSIVNKISQSICDKLDELDQLPEHLEDYLDMSANSDNYERFFTKFAKELLKLVESDIQVLVVIDEFGRFFKSDLSNTFMQLWKSVMELGAFNAILIGHDVVTQMMRADTNSFGVINTYQINYIDFDATQQLVTEPTRMKDQRSRFTDNAIQYIWEQSAGNVFYIQLICQATIRFMNDMHINIVNEVYVRQAIEEWLNTDADEGAYCNYGHPLFLSGEIGENAAEERETKIVLDAISISGNSATEGEIVKLAMVHHGQAENVTLIILKSLRARRVVDQDKVSGKYSIRCRFYPDFLNDHIIQSIE